MVIPEESGIIRIITCGVFKPAIDYIQMENRFPNVKVTYLDSNLHLRPQELHQQLLEQFEVSEQAGEKIVCLYGNCFAGINELCLEHGVTKITGDFCHDILLGPEVYGKIIGETAGTYFMEQEVICNFDKHCREPLELDDEIMKQYCFEHYSKLMYVRQPSDPELENLAQEIADFLELSLEICEADYSYLENKLLELIEPE